MRTVRNTKARLLSSIVAAASLVVAALVVTPGSAAASTTLTLSATPHTSSSFVSSGAPANLSNTVTVTGAPTGYTGTLDVILVGPASPTSGTCVLPSPTPGTLASFSFSETGDGTYTTATTPISSPGCYFWVLGETGNSSYGIGAQIAVITGDYSLLNPYTTLAITGTPTTTSNFTNTSYPAALSDSVTVTGAPTGYTGTLDVVLAGPAAPSAGSCPAISTSLPHAASFSFSESGDGTYNTTPAEITAPGRYYWAIAELGNASYGVEPQIVAPSNDTTVLRPYTKLVLTATPSPTSGFADATNPASLGNTITVSGGPSGYTGTLTSVLLGPANPVSGSCTDADYSGTHEVKYTFPESGNGTYTTPKSPVTSPGCYGWVVGESGDLSLGVSPQIVGIPGDFTTVGQFRTLTLSMSPNAQVAYASSAHPASLRNTVTVTGAPSGYSGTLTVVLAGPVATAGGSCAGASFLDAPQVKYSFPEAGNGTYATPAVSVTQPGCYAWVLGESGNTTYGVNPQLQAPSSGAVTVAPFSDIHISETPNLASAYASSTAPAGLSDTIQTTGAPSGYSGTLTVELLGPVPPVEGGCSGVSFSGAGATRYSFAESGNGAYTTPTSKVVPAGCYGWDVAESGNLSLGITPQHISPQATDLVLVVASSPTLSLGITAWSATCTVSGSHTITPTSVTGVIPDGNGSGYSVVNARGQTADCGAGGGANQVAVPSSTPVVGLSSPPSGNGYWEVSSNGGVFSLSGARFYGSMAGHPLNKPMVGMASTPDGKGYWLVAADGGVFSFGDAQFYGSMAGHSLNAPVVGMAVAAGGKGYWLVGADGGVFTFGAAQFKGTPSA